MSSKAILGAVAALVVVVGGYLVYRYVQLGAEARKWEGPIKEVVEESIKREGDVSTIHFVSVIEAPLDKVQKAMWGVEQGERSVENIRLSKLLKEDGNRKEVQIQVQLLSLPLQEFVMEFVLHPEQHRMEFKTLQSTSQDLEGRYQLEGSPDGKLTRITYDAKARARVPLPLPQSVQDSAQREFFVNTVRGIKKRALEG